ncbi:phage tail protein [Aeromonas sanarellii]
MSQVITNAFEQYWQSSLAAEQPVVLDEFILADIPDLDITSPIDPDTGLPPESQIVHRQNVDQRGRINNNAVAYTIVMDTTIGDFSFNAMYLRNKANGVIGMIVYKGRETKLKTDQTTGQTGNSLVKSMLMGYDQAAEATLTNVDAGTWQIDYAARLRGQDEDLRQLASQLYGHHTFIGDGFKVVQQDGGHQVTQGVAIVGGLRIELKQPQVIYPGTKPIGVWVDVHRSGSLLSEHQNHFTIITSVADLADHVDESGYQHYVAKLGTVQADSTVTDGRGQGGSGGSGAIPDTFALWKRSMAEAGYDLIGQFGTKHTIGTIKQVLLSKDGTQVYAWMGAIPKNVPADATPENAGGISPATWWPITTKSLRHELAEEDGSSLIGFRLNNTTGVLRTIHEVLSDWTSIKNFGVVGNGIADDTESVQKAFDTLSFAGGGTLYIPANMAIKCRGRIVGKKGVSIKCEPTSWLDFRGAGWLTPTNDYALFGYYGSAGAFIYPTGDMVEGDNKFNVPDATRFKVGDMLELSMDSPGKWHDTSVVVTAGQLAIVTGVYPGTNNIVISEPLYETLTVANGARIRIIDPIENVTVEGLGIIGNGRNPTGNAEQGLKFFFGRNVHIKRCYFKDVDTQSAGFVSCYGGSMEGNRADDAPLGSIDIISYGFVYASSMHIEIHGNHGINSRHGIISSHLAKSYGYYGISRFIDIHDNTHTSNYGDLDSGGFVRAHGGIATHTDAEFVNIYDNTVIGCRFGINVRTAGNSVKNNKVYDCPVGMYLSEYWADIEISDNEFFDCTLPFSTDNEPYEVERGTIDIHDNRMTRCGGSAFKFPTTVKSKLLLNNNNIMHPTNTGATATFSVYGNCDFTADGNNFDVNDTLAIRTEGMGMQTLLSNKIRSLIPYDSSASLYVNGSNNFIIKGNIITAPVGSLSGGIACPTKLAAPNSIVTNNDFIEV